jgi:hypothetical protein
MKDEEIKMSQEETHALEKSIRISIKVTNNGLFDDTSIMRLKRYTTFKREKCYSIYSV